MWAIFATPRIPAFGLGWTGLTGRGLDSPAIGSDTPGLWWFRHSGFRSGFSGLSSPDTPSIRPDTPDFWFRVALRPDRSDWFGIPV